MEFVEDAGRNVQAVLGCHLAGQHLIDAACWLIDHAFGRRNERNPSGQRRRLPDHVGGHIKHNAGLLAV